MNENKALKAVFLELGGEEKWGNIEHFVSQLGNPRVMEAAFLELGGDKTWGSQDAFESTIGFSNNVPDVVEDITEVDGSWMSEIKKKTKDNKKQEVNKDDYFLTPDITGMPIVDEQIKAFYTPIQIAGNALIGAVGSTIGAVVGVGKNVGDKINQIVYGIEDDDSLLSDMSNNAATAVRDYLKSEITVNFKKSEESPEQINNFSDFVDMIEQPEFWLNEGSQGLSSVTEFLIPGAIASKLGKGLELGSRFIRSSNKGKNLLGKTLDFARNRTADLADAFTNPGALTMAWLEGSVEAGQIYDEVEERAFIKYQQEGLEPEQALASARKDAADAASETVRANMSILIPTNAIELNAIFSKPGGNGIARATKFMGAALSSALSEATQEGLQFGIGEYEKAKYVHDLYQEDGSNNFEISGALNEINKAYQEGNPELYSSIFLGAILGGGAAVAGQGVNLFTPQEAKLAKRPSDLFKTNLDGSIKYDANNQPQIDGKKLKRHLKAVADSNLINQFKSHAEDNGNEHLFDFFETEQIARFAYESFEDGSSSDEVSEFIVPEFSKDYTDIFGNPRSADAVAEKITKVSDIYKKVNVVSKKNNFTRFQKKIFYDHSVREQFTIDKIKELESLKQQLEDSETTADKIRLKGVDSQLEELINLRQKYTKILNDISSVKTNKVFKEQEKKEEVKEALENEVPETEIAQEVKDEGLVKEVKEQLIQDKRDELFGEVLSDMIDYQRLKNKYKDSGVDDYADIIDNKFNQVYKQQKQDAADDYDPQTRYENRDILKEAEERQIDDLFRSDENIHSLLKDPQIIEEFLNESFEDKLSNFMYSKHYNKYHNVSTEPVDAAQDEIDPEETVEPVIETVEDLDETVERDSAEIPVTEDIGGIPANGVIITSVSPETHKFFDPEELELYEEANKAILRGEVSTDSRVILRVEKDRQMERFNTASDFIISVYVVDNQGNELLLNNLPSAKSNPKFEQVRNRMYEDYTQNIESTYTAELSKFLVRPSRLEYNRPLNQIQGLDLKKTPIILVTGKKGAETYVGIDRLGSDYKLPKVQNKTGSLYLMLPDPSGTLLPMKIYTKTFAESEYMKQEALRAIELGNTKDPDTEMTGNEILSSMVRFEQVGDYGPSTVYKNNDGTYGLKKSKMVGGKIENTVEVYPDVQSVYDALGLDNRRVHISAQAVARLDNRDLKYITESTEASIADQENGSFFKNPSVVLNDFVRGSTIKDDVKVEPVIEIAPKKKRKKRNIKPDTKFSRGDKMSLPKENDEDARKWFVARFPEVPYEISQEQIEKLYEIYNIGGGNIWGVFKNAAVYLAKNRPEGTTRHEAFHVAFNLFATDQQRRDLLLEMYDRNPDRFPFSREELIEDIESPTSQIDYNTVLETGNQEVNTEVNKRFTRHVAGFKNEKQFHTRLNNVLERISKIPNNITKKLNEVGVKYFYNPSGLKLEKMSYETRKKSGIYDVNLTSTAFRKIKEKYKNNVISVTNPIKIDASPIVLDFIEEVRGSILSFGNIKSVSVSEFISYSKEYLNNYSPHAISFLEGLGYEDYMISNAFNYVIPGTESKPIPNKYRNLTPDQIENLNPFERRELIEILGLENEYATLNGIRHELEQRELQELIGSPEDNVKTTNNKIGLFYDHQKIQSSLNSHFRSNPYAWGTLVYFYQDENSTTKNAALIHEIQNDFYERMKTISSSSLSVSQIMQSMLQSLSTDKKLPAIFKNFNITGSRTDFVENEFDLRFKEFKALSLPIPYGEYTNEGFEKKLKEQLSNNAIDILQYKRAYDRIRTLSLNKIKEFITSPTEAEIEKTNRIIRSIESIDPQEFSPHREQLVMGLKDGIDVTNLLNSLGIPESKHPLENKISLKESIKTKNGKRKKTTERQALQLVKNKLLKDYTEEITASNTSQKNLLATYQDFKTFTSLDYLSKEEREDIFGFIWDEIHNIASEIKERDSIEKEKIDPISKHRLKNYSKQIIHHIIQKVIAERGRNFPIYFAGYEATNLLQQGSPGVLYAGPEEVQKGLVDKVGRLYKDISSISGIKLEYVDSIPGMRSGGYKVDISEYNLEGIPVFSKEGDNSTLSPSVQVEEAMAEIFEDLKEDSIKPRTKLEKFLNKMKDFIMDFYYTLKSYVSEKTTIDEFFRAIDRNTLGRNLVGQRKKSAKELFKRNVDNLLDARFSSDGLTNFEVQQATRLINKELLNILVEEDLKTGDLLGIKANSIKEFIEDDRVVDYFKKNYKGSPQYNALIAIYNQSIELLEDYKEETGFVEEYDRIINSLKEGIRLATDFNNSQYVDTEQFAKTGLLHTLLLDLRLSQGIQLDIKEVSTTTNENADLEINEEENILESWQVNYTKVNPMESLSAKFRWLIGSIELKNSNGEIMRDNIGAARYINASSIFNSLLFNIGNSTSPQEMMNKLESLEAYQPWVRDFRANLDEGLISELYTRVGRTVTPNFKTVVYKDGKTHIFNSNRRGVGSLILSEFRSDFENLFKTSEGYLVPQSIIKSLYEQKNKLEKANSLTKSDLDILLEVFNSAGLIMTEQTIEGLNSGSHDGEKKVNGLTALTDITNGLLKIANKANEGINPFAQIDGELTTAKRISNYLRSSNLDLSMLTFLNIEGEKIYNNIQSSWMYKQIHDLQRGLVDYTDSVYHANAPIYQWINSYGKSIELAPIDGYKENISGTKYSDMEASTQYAMNINSWLSNIGKKDGLTYYRVGTLSDAGVSYFMKLPYFEQITGTMGQAGVIDYLFDVAMQEWDRIQMATNADPSFSIKNYLEWKKDENGNPIINEAKSNALKFHYFPFLNDGNLPMLNGAVDEVKTKSLIKKYMEKNFLDFVKKLETENLVSIDKDRKVHILDRLDERVQNIKTFKGDLTTSTVGSLRLYFYNSFLMNTQMDTIFSDDPAMYKKNKRTDEGLEGIAKQNANLTSLDYQKRNKQVHAPGIFGNFKNELYSVLYINDIELPSSLLSFKEDKSIDFENSNIYKLFISYGVSKAEAKRISSLYTNNNITDAGAFHTLERRREIEIAYNRWNPKKQTAYDKILSGQGTIEDELQFFGPLKPHVFTKLKIGSGSGIVTVPTQHKNAEFTLTPRLAEVSKDLTKLLELMNENNISTVMFDSAVKVGLHNAINWGDKVESKNIHQIPNADWKIQNEVPQHLLDTTNLFGTQIRKHIMANIDLNGTYDIEGQSMTGSEMFELYQSLINENILEDLRKTDRRLGANSSDKFDKLRSALLSEIDSRGLGQQYREAVDIVHNKITNSQDFALPLWHPALAKLQPVINSFYKSVTKQKFPGGSFVNMPSFGLEDLKIVWKGSVEDGTYSIDYVETAAPVSYKFLIKKYGDKNGIIDINKLPAKFKKAMEGVVYRIPTEDKYSMFPIKIVKFLPTESSGVIVLPREATTIAGLDFDVDKVFAMMYHLDQNGLNEDLSTTDGRNNKILDIIRGVLRNPHHTVEFLNPGGFDRLKEMRDNINQYFSLSEEENLALPQVQVTLSDRNLVGGRMIGVAANDNAFHSLAMHTNLTTRPLLFNGKTEESEGFNVFSITQKYDETGVTISRNFAEILAASVDNAKDPVLGDLNINSFTIPVVSYILHHGYSLETAIYFVNQPTIRDFVKEYYFAKNNGTTEYSFLMGAAKNIENYGELSNSNIFLSYLKGVGLKTKSEDSILAKFIKLKFDSNPVVSVVQASRFDSGSAGPTMIDIDTTLQSINAVHSELSYKIGNLSEFLPKIDEDLNIVSRSKIESMNGFLEIILDEVKYVKDYFPYFRKSLMQIKSKMLNILPSYTSRFNTTQLKLINDHVLGIFASPLFEVPARYKNLEEFIFSFPNYFIRKVPEVSKGRFATLLSLFTESTVGKSAIPILKLKRSSGLNTEDINSLKIEFEEFIKEEPELALELISYSFLTIGFSFNRNSFSHLFPTSLFKNNRAIIEQIDANADGLSDEMLQTIIINIVKNHSSSLLPLMQDENVEKIGGENSKIYLTSSPLMANKDTPVPFVTVKDPKTSESKLLVLTEYNESVNSAIYTEIEKLGMDGVAVEFKNTSEFSKNKLSYSAEELEALKNSEIVESFKLEDCG